MTASIVGTGEGRTTWSGKRSEEGQRDFSVTFLVQVTDPTNDGPQTVMNTPGLPAIGSIWDQGNDSDVWVFNTGERAVTPKIKGEPNEFWTVTDKYSNKPRKRCQDETIEDPLLEPDRISGSFVKYTEEAVRDKDGDLIKSSSHEFFRGPGVEFDANRPTVQIGQNVPDLELEVFSAMVDTLNDATLWGLSTRKIKLSNVTWERLLWGICDFYYVRNLEFDINFNTFDRDLLDEGTKVLRGHAQTCGTGTGTGTGSEANVWLLDGSPDPNNPLDFVRYKDCHGENLRVVLDGAGLPLTDSANPVYVRVEKYTESNLLLLGIPTTLT